MNKASPPSAATLRQNALDHLWMPFSQSRSYAEQGGPPILVSGSGVRVTDIDGKTYIDAIGAMEACAVGHGRQIGSERRAKRTHHLLDGIERNAADQKELIAHCCLFIRKGQRPHNLRLAICAPCTSALSLAQATSG